MPLPPSVDIDLAQFGRDPYPDLARLRREAPIAFVPQLDSVLFTRRVDIVVCEKNVAVFSSHQPGGLMNELMGHNMMRKDGAAHQLERKQFFPTVSPVTVRDHWKPQFQSIANTLLEELAPKRCADLVTDYAMPLSGACLAAMTGLTNLTAEEMDRCSQGMIDGIANYTGDAAVQARCHAATQTIDHAIDDKMPSAASSTSPDMLSVALAAGMPVESIRANIKLAISGGQNEPRDAIAGAIWALLEHPKQLGQVLSGDISWLQVFEEYARWVSPIGMSPRRIAQDFTYRDIDLVAEQRAFLMFGAANRDEDWFENPELFDITRHTSKSIAFGAGPHFCAGAWASRAMIADVALPSIFNQLSQLQLQPQAHVQMAGWAFRGLINLPVQW